MAEITGQEVLQVNTFHHQAIRKLAPGFKITAWAPDSIAEAIEAYPIRQMIGVQFHPKYLQQPEIPPCINYLNS